MDLASFGQLDRRLALYHAELSGKAAQARLVEVAKVAAADITAAVQATPAKDGSLADASMSHWHRRGERPFSLSGHYEISGDNVVEIGPAAEGAHWRRGAGPMRILESGRPAYKAGDRRSAGRYISKRTGEVTEKTRKVKRATGEMAGKGTWSDAERRFKAHASTTYVRAFERDWNRIARGG